MLSNPSLADQLATTIRQGINKSVQEGNMTQEQADQAFEFARPGSTWFTLLSVGGTVFWSIIVLFGLGLVYWLLGKSALHATAPYMKVVEVVGLTMFISSLEYIVTTLLMFVMDSIHATPGLGIFVSDFDTGNKLHVALSKVNAFTFWDLTVVSIGLSRLFQRDLPKVLVLVFVLWVLWSLVTIFTGLTVGG
jgi:hypothetical protein